MLLVQLRQHVRWCVELYRIQGRALEVEGERSIRNKWFVIMQRPLFNRNVMREYRLMGVTVYTRIFPYCQTFRICVLIFDK